MRHNLANGSAQTPIILKHSVCSLVRKYYFLTSDSIAIFANYFQCH
jgi:hypothetical protein